MLRREVITTAGKLFGLGAGTPSRFPYPDRPQPGAGVAPSSGAVFRGRLVIVFGPAGTVDGVFVYAPGTTPGPGNTPIAALTASATDPFGNDVQPGDASASGTIIAIGTAPVGGTPSFVQLAPGNPASFLISSGDSAEATAGHIDSLISGGGAARNLNLRLTSPKVTGHSTALSQMLLASEAADGSQGPLCLIVATDGVNSSTFEVVPTGTVVAVGPFISTAGTAANSTQIKTDVWNNMGLAAGFAAGVPAPQFKLMPDLTVMCRGIVTLSANQAASTVFATLGANYTAAHGTQFVTRNTLSGYAAGNGSVANAGGASTLAIVVAGVTGNVVQLDGVRYSTDA